MSLNIADVIEISGVQLRTRTTAKVLNPLQDIPIFLKIQQDLIRTALSTEDNLLRDPHLKTPFVPHTPQQRNCWGFSATQSKIQSDLNLSLKKKKEAKERTLHGQLSR